MAIRFQIFLKNCKNSMINILNMAFVAYIRKFVFSEIFGCFLSLLFIHHTHNTYTLLQICSTPTFPIFNLSGFERELLKLHKQMISHFVALDVGYIICQVQLCNCIRGCHATFLLKNTLFKQEVAWQPLREQQGCSPSMLGPHIRAFK